MSFTIFTVSVRKILDTTSYDINSKIFSFSRLLFMGDCLRLESYCIWVNTLSRVIQEHDKESGNKS